MSDKTTPIHEVVTQKIISIFPSRAKTHKTVFPVLCEVLKDSSLKNEDKEWIIQKLSAAIQQAGPSAYINHRNNDSAQRVRDLIQRLGGSGPKYSH